jgi:hypothetical protein
MSRSLRKINKASITKDQVGSSRESFNNSVSKYYYLGSSNGQIWADKRRYRTI